MSRIQNRLSENKIRAKKRLGQNFLSNEQALESITRSANLSKSDCVLEIGAGMGNLSAMIAPLAGEFYALEKDLSFKKILNKELACFKNTTIIFSDILKFDLACIFSGTKIKVIGNLPYYITSPILLHLLGQRKYIKSIVITVQKEVAERIVASPGSKNYGRLSCLLQYHTKPQLLEIFPKHFFIPKPKVDSALVKLEILDNPSVKVEEEKMFFKVVKAIFLQRRKTLLNGLSNAGWQLSKKEIAVILENLDIAPSIRGENLTLHEIARISDAIFEFL
ncbi:MAG: 16S rRNA (adenine(1518)-N(6)/adenine(1519)-N(6))-dimethyltransferase RsmA [Candidatus Omnitrophica bacterium]|nr:16S rRNA (adenine(1518)-N(6)/adenine(1519)-N(6))-dimethyltransferase RsmA [Candidatus Omnitrophota bacterium]